MATLCSTLANGTTLNFVDFASAGPRYYLDLIPSGPVYDNKRFRAPGWNGNVLIRSGFTGQQLILNVRYQGTLAAATAAWKSDAALMSAYNTAITDGVTTWSRCTLRSSDRTSEELAHGGATKFFSVRYLFDVEELY